jgi:hypothetical protein
MKTMTAQVVIETDGKLRLELPTDLPPGPAEVVVVVQPKSPAGSFPSLGGRLAGKMPANLDVVEEVRGIRRRASQEPRELPQ